MLMPSTATCQRTPSAGIHRASTSGRVHAARTASRRVTTLPPRATACVDPGLLGAVGAGDGEQPDPDERRHEQEEGQCHRVTPATARTTTPTTTATSPAEGEPRWASSPPRPAHTVMRAAARG